MKALIVLFLIILASIVAGYYIHKDPGYILIAYNHTTIETSLWIGIACLVMIYVLIKLLTWVIKQFTTLGERISAWSTYRRKQKIEKVMRSGLIELLEGNWKKAEKMLSKACEKNTEPLIFYLGAAKAANEQKKFLQRDEYLTQASKMSPQIKTVIALTQAELQINAKQWEHALATLKLILETSPTQTKALALISKVCIHTKEWQVLITVLPQLEKLQIKSEADIKKLELKAYQHLLCENFDWEIIPKHLQNNTQLLALYCSNLIKSGEDDQAATLIEQRLKKQWNNTLASYYFSLNHSNPAYQIKQAEKWLKKYPNDIELLTCLGRLNLSSQFYGKAKDYLEHAVSLSDSQQARILLAKVLILLDNKAAALQCITQISEC